MFTYSCLSLATEYHLGLLKAKLARYRAQLIEPSSKSGAGKGEGFDVLKSGDARVALIGFPSVGKVTWSMVSADGILHSPYAWSRIQLICMLQSTLLTTVTKTQSEAAGYEFTTLTCIPGVIEVSLAFLLIQLLVCVSFSNNFIPVVV